MPNRIMIEFQLDEEILKRVANYAESHGLLIEELLRFVVGEKFQKPMPVDLSHLPVPGTMPAPEDKMPAALENIMKLAMRINPVKCDKCERKLSFEELSAGECESCGNKL